MRPELPDAEAVIVAPGQGSGRRQLRACEARKSSSTPFRHCAYSHRSPSGVLVYAVCMSRTNIDLDDEACRAVMERYQLSTKRDAVNFALRTLAAEPLGVDEARRLRGSGWEGDLDEMRASRAG